MTTFFIEHQCPQCGAPAILEESDRLVRCPYCRVASYLIQHPYFRYMLPNSAPENRQLIYVPYWRFKGMLFSSVSGGIQHRFMDMSYQGIQSHYFPASLGFRSQTLKLKFVLPETPGRFLHPTFSSDEAMKIFINRFSKNLPSPVYHQDFVGETLSIIYSPFYVKNQIVDALLNKAVTNALPDDFSIESFLGGTPKWRLIFVPTLCPHCGWDLSGERDSLVLICKNCHTAWLSKGERLTPVKYATLKIPGNIFLPFWRIKATVEGVGLNSYADLIRIANLPKVPQSQDHETDFFFWSMAFKVPPKVFLRLNRNITMAQPRNRQVNELPSGYIHPVTLPINEAAESMKINFASFACPSNHYLPFLHKINIRPEKARLVFIPFHEGHHELIQENFGLTINKNQLKLSSNL
jgi:predicted Zn-ribbon and HTH transcriptional regulator